MTIKEAREKAGLSQVQLANAIGKSRQQICNWESGLRNPKLDSLKLIAKACHVEVSELL